MKNQKQFIINELNINGKISRNYCLSQFISRLGAYVCDLQKEGWKFKPETLNGDYVYTVIEKPSRNAPQSHTSPLDAFNSKSSNIPQSLFKLRTITY
jgi:hypothetical protein